MIGAAPNALRRPWYREPYLWMLIGIPACSVLGSALLIWLAMRSDDGVVAADYYRQGLEINRVLDREEAAVAQGIVASYDISPDEGSLRITLQTRSGRPLPGMLHLSFLHATRAGFDAILDLPLSPAGVYAGALPALAPGRYHLHVSAEDWRLRTTLVIPEGRQARGAR